MVNAPNLLIAPNRETQIMPAPPSKSPSRQNQPSGGKSSDRPNRPAPRPPRSAVTQAAAIDAREATEGSLFGIHPIAAALANPSRTILKLWLTENAERRLGDALAGSSVPIERVRPKDLDKRLGPDTVHQGAFAEVTPLPELALDDVTAFPSASPDGSTPQAGPLVILDQVTDPQNVGAVLRSAAVFGASGLIMTRRHSPPLGGTLAKAASGALEAVPVVLVQNLGEAMQALVSDGYTLVGLDGEGPVLLDDATLTGRIAIVLGAEGKGLRQRTRELCTHLCRIAAPGQIASLNVSNAAAITLHLAAFRRRTAA